MGDEAFRELERRYFAARQRLGLPPLDPDPEEIKKSKALEDWLGANLTLCEGCEEQLRDVYDDLPDPPGPHPRYPGFFPDEVLKRPFTRCTNGADEDEED